MQQLATKRRSAAELDSYIDSNLGFLSFRAEVISQPDWKLAAPKLTVAAGALSEKIDALAQIPAEVWSETLFEDIDRIHDVLVQMRIGAEQSFLNAGHAAALARAMSYVSPAAVVAQQLSGVDFYRFLRDLLDNFDERKDSSCRQAAGAPGAHLHLHQHRDQLHRFGRGLPALLGGRRQPGPYAPYRPCQGALRPMPEPRREAFIIPSDVCYVARSTDPRVLDIQMDGTWAVAAQAVTYEYLWNEIRVKGSTYGCGFRAMMDRQLAFYTYRDPAIDPSLERIARTGEWLSTFEPTQDAFEGMVVSCASGFDAPIKPYALTKRQDNEYFAKRPANWRLELREQLLKATPEDLRQLAKPSRA